MSTTDVPERPELQRLAAECLEQAHDDLDAAERELGTLLRLEARALRDAELWRHEYLRRAPRGRDVPTLPMAWDPLSSTVCVDGQPQSFSSQPADSPLVAAARYIIDAAGYPPGQAISIGKLGTRLLDGEVLARLEEPPLAPSTPPPGTPADELATMLAVLEHYIADVRPWLQAVWEQAQSRRIARAARVLAATYPQLRIDSPADTPLSDHDRRRIALHPGEGVDQVRSALQARLRHAISRDEIHLEPASAASLREAVKTAEPDQAIVAIRQLEAARRLQSADDKTDLLRALEVEPDPRERERLRRQIAALSGPDQMAEPLLHGLLGMGVALVAAPPGTGKTALDARIAVTVVLADFGVPVLAPAPPLNPEYYDGISIEVAEVRRRLARVKHLRGAAKQDAARQVCDEIVQGDLRRLERLRSPAARDMAEGRSAVMLAEDQTGDLRLRLRAATTLLHGEATAWVNQPVPALDCFEIIPDYRNGVRLSGDERHALAVHRASRRAISDATASGRPSLSPPRYEVAPLWAYRLAATPLDELVDLVQRRVHIIDKRRAPELAMTAASTGDERVVAKRHAIQRAVLSSHGGLFPGYLSVAPANAVMLGGNENDYAAAYEAMEWLANLRARRPLLATGANHPAKRQAGAPQTAATIADLGGGSRGLVAAARQVVALEAHGAQIDSAEDVITLVERLTTSPDFPGKRFLHPAVDCLPTWASTLSPEECRRLDGLIREGLPAVPIRPDGPEINADCEPPKPDEETSGRDGWTERATGSLGGPLAWPSRGGAPRARYVTLASGKLSEAEAGARFGAWLVGVPLVLGDSIRSIIAMGQPHGLDPRQYSIVKRAFAERSPSGTARKAARADDGAASLGFALRQLGAAQQGGGEGLYLKQVGERLDGPAAKKWRSLRSHEKGGLASAMRAAGWVEGARQKGDRAARWTWVATTQNRDDESPAGTADS